MFNPNVYPCHRVFHQLPERVLMTKRHSDGRGGERALEFHLVDHVLDCVADSPALGIAGGVAAGAGLPGLTEILKSRRGVWICHLGPFRVRASDACSRSTRCEDGSQLSTCSSATATAARSRGSTEHVLGLRFTGFLMVSSVRRGNQIAGFPGWLGFSNHGCAGGLESASLLCSDTLPRSLPTW